MSNWTFGDLIMRSWTWPAYCVRHSYHVVNVLLNDESMTYLYKIMSCHSTLYFFICFISFDYCVQTTDHVLSYSTVMKILNKVFFIVLVHTIVLGKLSLSLATSNQPSRTRSFPYLFLGRLRLRCPSWGTYFVEPFAQRSSYILVMWSAESHLSLVVSFPTFIIPVLELTKNSAFSHSLVNFKE